jgi:hypothetical protein
LAVIPGIKRLLVVREFGGLLFKEVRVGSYFADRSLAGETGNRRSNTDETTQAQPLTSIHPSIHLPSGFRCHQGREDVNAPRSSWKSQLLKRAVAIFSAGAVQGAADREQICE